MSNYEAKIYDALARFAILFSEKPSEERLMAYVDELRNYSPEEISKALNQLKTEAHKFPSLASIVQIIKPSLTDSDRANDVMALITEAIGRFGGYRQGDALDFLGPVAWRVVEGLGGWWTLCQCSYTELGVMRSQARELAKSALKHELRFDDSRLNHLINKSKSKLKISDGAL